MWYILLHPIVCRPASAAGRLQSHHRLTPSAYRSRSPKIISRTSPNTSGNVHGQLRFPLQQSLPVCDSPRAYILHPTPPLNGARPHGLSFFRRREKKYCLPQANRYIVEERGYPASYFSQSSPPRPFAPCYFISPTHILEHSFFLVKSFLSFSLFVNLFFSLSFFFFGR